jgi:hypothetical protein
MQSEPDLRETGNSISNLSLLQAKPGTMDTLYETTRSLLSKVSIQVFCCFKSFGSKGKKIEFFPVLHALSSGPIPDTTDHRRKMADGGIQYPGCRWTVEYLIRRADIDVDVWSLGMEHSAVGDHRRSWATIRYQLLGFEVFGGVRKTLRTLL